MADEQPQRKPGRRTREEEIDLYLSNLGLSREQLEAKDAADDAPTTFAEMLDLAAAHVWSEFKDLKGTAKVQAFNAIRQLAKDDPEGGQDEQQEPTVFEIVTGIPQLTPERKREILAGALERLDVERAQILEVLNG